jgi:hypothetical protein
MFLQKRPSKAMAAFWLLLAATSAWGQQASVVLEVDPSGNGEFFPTGCFDVQFDWTGGPDAQSSSFRIQYDPNILSLNELATTCEATPAIAHAVTCVDGTAGATQQGFRTYSVIYGSTNPPSQISDHVLGPVNFCVNGGLQNLPTTTTIDFAQISGSIGTADDSAGENLAISAGPQSQIAVTPDPLDFETQLVGSTSNSLAVTIRNEGAAQLAAISYQALAGLQASDFALASGGTCGSTPFSLAPNTSCTQRFTFTPSALGIRTATFTVDSDADVVVDNSITLQGDGIPSDAVLGIDPLSFDFGQLDLLAPAQCTDLTISNEGGGDPLEIGTVTVSDLYSVTDNCDGEVLTQTGTCVVSVCFDPATVDTFIGTVTVTSNTPDVDNVTATVEGDGLEIPALTVNPDFGPVSIGLGDTLGSVTNAGSADGTFSCDLTDTGGVTGAITVAPSLSGGITVPASDGTTDGSVDFTLSCDLAVGESSQANLVCTGDLAGTHNISCSAAPVVVSTMQNWGLILMALMMMLVGGLSIRFFRT